MTLTAIFTAYATILSTVVFLWNVVRSRPSIKVQLVLALDKIDGEYVSGVHVSVQNPSAHPVYVTSISLMYPYKNVSLTDRVRHWVQFKQFSRRIGWVYHSLSLCNIDDGCPIKIEAGDSHSVMVPEEKIEQTLEKAIEPRLIGVAQDALWQNTYSQKFDAITKKEEN